MKKFKMGTMLILIVGLLLIQNTISFANNPIKLLISERSKYKGELLRDKSMLDAEISRLQKLGKL